MRLFIPIISAILYLLGGQINKWFRWLGIGLLIGAFYAITRHSLYPLLAIITYFIALNAFSYGENSWTTKIFGKWASMAISGLAMGLASIVVLGAFWGIIQGIVGMVSFLILKYLDDKDIVKNPFQELGRGFFGTIMYWVK